jgi:signal transduction histidine kinase
LAALHGYLETLQMKKAEQNAEQQAEYLKIAMRQSHRLKHMVEALFELAQLEARESLPVPESINLAELASDVVQKFQLRAEERGVALRMEPPDFAPVVMADAALIERVLDNLLGNALDHTQLQGEVTLSLTEVGDYAQVAVDDTGPGIPAADLPQLFEPFYRATDKNRKGQHAGLGLAIAKRIVELHSGRMAAENRVAGGARFSFTLPLG